jgi:hypothetical protein
MDDLKKIVESSVESHIVVDKDPQADENYFTLTRMIHLIPGICFDLFKSIIGGLGYAAGVYYGSKILLGPNLYSKIISRVYPVFQKYFTGA